MWFLDRPELADFGGLGGPGGQNNPFQQVGREEAHRLEGFFPAAENHVLRNLVQGYNFFGALRSGLRDAKNIEHLAQNYHAARPHFDFGLI